eukprot:m51a1_g4692 putative serine threonine-protein kinase rio1-like (632) ;mRNA; r:196753-199306
MSSGTATTTRRAWATPTSTPPPAAASLASIMDEELARREQRREELLAGLPAATQAPAGVDDESLARALAGADGTSGAGPARSPEGAQEEEASTEDDDYAYALQLQAQLDAEVAGVPAPAEAPAEVAEAPAAPEAVGAASVDEDYAFALQLQAQLDAEALTDGGAAPDTRTQQQKQEQMSGAHDATIAKSVSRAMARHKIRAEPTKEQSAPASGRQQQQQPTKHDPELCAKRNAERIERFAAECGDVSDVALPAKGGYNLLREHARRDETTRVRRKEASDAARSDAVLDASTRITLLGLLNAGVIADLGGVVSSGKEANVYHAASGPAASRESGRPLCEGFGECAVKVFKTMNEFRHRDVYISGDFLVQYDKARLHPRKCIQLWAQKELRNLAKMHKHGIRCPRPVGLYGHVLVMEFLGSGGVAAPMLRDARLSEAEWRAAYAECAQLVRELYQRCSLVHADLSEYNLLWHASHVWAIDVAQAVSTDHPNATLFLRRDCRNLSAFFRRRLGAAATLPARTLFEYACDPTMAQGGDEGRRLAALLASAGPAESEEDAELEEEALMGSYMPRVMRDVRDPVAFAEGVAHGDPDCLSHLTVVGLRPVGAPEAPEQPEEEQEQEEGDEEPGDVVKW